MENTEIKSNKISRGKFLVHGLAGGAGVVLSTTILSCSPIRRFIYEKAEGTTFLTYSGDTKDPLLWFEITRDNKIILRSTKVEMGQGVFTGLAQMAADELEVDISMIKVTHAETAIGNIDGASTGGSTSTAGLWEPLRELSATMREMIRIEGAKKLGADLDKTTVSNGKVIANGKSMTYGEVVDGVEKWKVPKTPKLKKTKDYKYVGKPTPRVDLEDKVYGTPMFGMDASMPDMLYGSIVHPTKIGATFVSADTSKAASMPGVVKIVQEKDFVGVVAKSYTEAERAKLAIKATWSTERDWSSEDIEEATQVGKGDKMVAQKDGSVDGIFSQAKENGELITAEFKSPIGAHAQLEPNGAVAYVEDGKATIMIATQVIGHTRKEVAEVLGLEEENVNVIPAFVGGGFGRRLHTPNAMKAALLSKAVGKPVKCFYNRKEEFQKDTFRPPTHHILKAKLKSDGMIEAIQHDYASGDVAYGSPIFPQALHNVLGTDIGSLRGARFIYSGIKNKRVVGWHSKLPFATSWWRSLGLLANTFAIESFIDELAIKAGKDPIQYRLDQIKNDENGQRMRKVIEMARDKSGYQNKGNGNRAMGFACSVDAGTPCAHVVEVTVKGKEIQVDKVTCVIDPGFAVNPDQVKAQCEGSIIMGMSAAMYEKMEVKKSELSPVIYGPYKMAMMKNAPKEINVEIINGTGIPGAVGEPPMGPIGAAVANAVFRVNGYRNREMPLKAG